MPAINSTQIGYLNSSVRASFDNEKQWMPLSKAGLGVSRTLTPLCPSPTLKPLSRESGVNVKQRVGERKIAVVDQAGENGLLSQVPGVTHNPDIGGLQLLARLSGQDKIVANDTLSLSLVARDSVSAILNNPASTFLACAVIALSTYLRSKKYQDMVGSGPGQPLDASLTPEDILNIATIGYYSPEPPETLPPDFIDAMHKASNEGVVSGSAPFEENPDGELVLKENNSGNALRTIMFRSLARESRKSASTISATEQGREDIGDSPLALLIKDVLPHTAENDRAIIHRTLMLKDHQKTTWKAWLPGSSWPSDREEQIRILHRWQNSVAQSLTPEADPVVQALNDDDIELGWQVFSKLSLREEILPAINRLKHKPDICMFDQSGAVYRELQEALSGVHAGREREAYILEQTLALCRDLGLSEKACAGDKFNEMAPGQVEQQFALMKKQKSHLERHKIKKNREALKQVREQVRLLQQVRQAIQLKNTVALVLESHEDALRQKAWELMLYQYDIKIGAEEELKALEKLQLRLTNEKVADTATEAQYLSQTIPERLGPRALTCYEKFLRHKGRHGKLPVSYQRLCFTGPELAKALDHYRQIKAITSEHYPTVFGRDDVVATSREEIIMATSLACLMRLMRQQSESEWLPEKLENVVVHQLRQQKRTEAYIHSVESD